MSLKYEPASEPQHISVKWLFLTLKPKREAGKAGGGLVPSLKPGSGSNVIPMRARPGLAGLRPHTERKALNRQGGAGAGPVAEAGPHEGEGCRIYIYIYIYIHIYIYYIYILYIY